MLWRQEAGGRRQKAEGRIKENEASINSSPSPHPGVWCIPASPRLFPD
ncbi:MAG: hypothetical protein F6J86_14330 [Symploca sp. SIO1B1]|nr:hypothetical protein [Symploca sp. SIO1A3]NER94992.1 hypothetical protein [Symploca sp. SIO1B1]